MATDMNGTHHFRLFLSRLRNRLQLMSLQAASKFHMRNGRLSQLYLVCNETASLRDIQTQYMSSFSVVMCLTW